MGTMTGSTTGRRDLDEAAVAALESRINEEIDAGRLGAAQYAIARGGEVLAQGAFGAATDDTRFVMFSATKALVAMALLPHLADGSLELTAPVASLIPEFGEHGKGEVTVLQLLTMQGGFPMATMHPKRYGTSAGRRQTFASWRLEWPAGSQTIYHPISAHWVIAELVETLSGQPYAEAIHERVTAPAGVDPLLGAEAFRPSDRPDAGPVLDARVIGEHPGVDDPRLVELFGGRDAVPVPTIGTDALLFMNDDRSRAAGIPGGGGIARAQDVARTYQSFLADDSPWRRDAIGTIRNASIGALDRIPANRTVACVVAGHDGHHARRWFPAAPRAFGHHGAGGQLCWGDPDRGLSFCFLHDTLDQDPGAEFVRCRDINELASECARP